MFDEIQSQKWCTFTKLSLNNNQEKNPFVSSFPSSSPSSISSLSVSLLFFVWRIQEQILTLSRKQILLLKVVILFSKDSEKI